MSELKLENS